MSKSKIVVAVGTATGSSSAKAEGMAAREIVASPRARALSFPDDEQTKIHFEAYALALGKVAHAWNYLFEKLGRLFVIVAGGNPHVATAIWYAPDSDRTKVAMLKEAICTPGQTPFWLPEFPTAKDDIQWLLERVANLTDMRNNVIHAPCILLTNAEGTGMSASFNGHLRAKKLWGKEILVEFDWCERWTEELSRFCRAMEEALLDRRRAWPGRPPKPDRKPKKALLSELLQE
jgi:hypothetical protein